MPTVLKDKVKVVRSGRKPTHDYENWFAEAAKASEAGGSLQLVRGKDFDSTLRTMRHNLYRTSSAKGLKINTAILVSEDGTESITINDIRPLTQKEIKAKASKS